MDWWVVQKAEDESGKLGMRLACGVPGEWQEVTAPGGISYRRRLDAGRRDEEARQLASALTVYLLDDYQPYWIGATVDRYYPFFLAADHAAILAYALGRLEPGPDSAAERRDTVQGRLYQFLTEHSHIVLDGAITFLLRDIGQDVQAAVDQAVDDLLLENEHREFLRLLRGFLAIKEARVPEAHVLPVDDGFRVEDADGRPVATELWQELAHGLSPEGTAEDLLLSFLVSVAPARVTLHQGGKPRPSLTMVEAVFEGRATQCPGCGRCGGSGPPLLDAFLHPR
jgi:putative sporulation protein YtxC